MAQLPTAEALGERPIPRPVTSVAVADTGHEARALQELGRTVTEMGTKLAEARRGAEYNDALGKASEELEVKASEFSRDQDFKTAPNRFKGIAKTIGETYAKSIDDGVARDMFTREYGRRALERQIGVVKQAAKQEQDYHTAAMDDRESIYVRKAVEAPEGVERGAVLQEAQGDLAVMRAAGWISDVEAGKRERGLRAKIDQAVVTRDLAADPAITAARLSTDAGYAPNIDPVTRERMVDHAFRRAETERGRADRDAERARKAKGDDLMKNAWELQSQGRLTRGYVEGAKAFVEPSEYKALLTALEGRDVKDDPRAFAELQQLVYDNPREAEKRAFEYQSKGRITNETLASTLSRARGVDRQDGPRSPYERERQYITGVLKPSPFADDPAGAARHAEAMREFDDYANDGKRSDAELRAKADDITKRWSLTNMADLAKRTSAEVRNDPKVQLESLQRRAAQLKTEFDGKKITQQKFNQEMANINKAVKAAQAAETAGGRR